MLSALILSRCCLICNTGQIYNEARAHDLFGGEAADILWTGKSFLFTLRTYFSHNRLKITERMQLLQDKRLLRSENVLIYFPSRMLFTASPYFPPAYEALRRIQQAHLVSVLSVYFLRLQQLLGIALRSDIPLALDLLPSFWKSLLNLPIDLQDDLRECDILTYNYIRRFSEVSLLLCSQRRVRRISQNLNWMKVSYKLTLRMPVLFGCLFLLYSRYVLSSVKTKSQKVEDFRSIRYCQCTNSSFPLIIPVTNCILAVRQWRTSAIKVVTLFVIGGKRRGVSDDML